MVLPEVVNSPLLFGLQLVGELMVTHQHTVSTLTLTLTLIQLLKPQNCHVRRLKDKVSLCKIVYLSQQVLLQVVVFDEAPPLELSDFPI